jgi:hypothetical protein
MSKISETTILLPKAFDKLLDAGSSTMLRDINQAIYAQQPDQVKAAMIYANYHNLIKPLEDEGIKTWPDLVDELDLIGDKKSKRSKRIRDYVIAEGGFILSMARFSDEKYNNLTQEQKDSILESEEYFDYGEFESKSTEGEPTE